MHPAPRSPGRAGRIVWLAAAAFCLALPAPSLAAPCGGDDDDQKAEKEIKIAENDPAFQSRVNGAVSRGIQSLLSKQAPDGHWPSQHEKAHFGPFPHGATALALLALLKSGANRFDEHIEKGFKFLKESWDNFQKGGRKWNESGGWRTYEAGITIMALEALARWKPPGAAAKKGHTRAMGGKLKRPQLEWVKELRDFLLENRTVTRQKQVSGPNGTTVEKKVECWHYPTTSSGSTDHSNTQYAVLGLQSASRLGFPSPSEVWIGILTHFFEVQEQSGPKVNRVIMPPRRKNKENYFRPHTVSSISDRARGFGYFGHDVPKPTKGEMGCTTGSMTTVGVACIEIAWARLQKLARRDKDARKFITDRKTRGAKEKAINDGFAWLGKHFTVTENPFQQNGGWHYYYLYGLERAGVLGNRINIGAHDWYREGGELLLGAERNGAWESGKGDGPIGSTCFALLFLARATVPLVQTTR